MHRTTAGAASPRLIREQRTLVALFGLYCRHEQGDRPGLCQACQELLAYARARLARCPYGRQKPTCARCPIHCYQPAMRERMREMMRSAGPRLLLTRPLLVLGHWLDALRPCPSRPLRRR